MIEEPVRERVERAFVERFGSTPPLVVRAPGRVNLIGEHTDYNDGWVLPLTLERAVWLALRPTGDEVVRVWSTDYGESVEFRPSAPSRGGDGWGEYLKGTAWALAEQGHRLSGWEGTLGSDVPIGAGLSSSAALELATARAFAAASGFPWDAPSMARAAQRAENRWVGMNCGIMDQMISAVGRPGHAVLIDCRTLRTEAVPLPEETRVVVMDTDTRRGLVDSEYNERRTRCEEAASHFRVPALRDLTLERLEADWDSLDPVTARRARHVITENDRTLRAAEAMRRGEADTTGALMNESHDSLRYDFEVSSPALDAMVELAREQPGCHGARMTGAGFGGCAVALVGSAHAEAFVDAVTRGYESRTRRRPRLYMTGASAGAEVVRDG